MTSLAQSNRLCIGLTGGIGCGKSTVAQLFAAQGAFIIDTDIIAHQLTQTGGIAIAAIRDAFGADYITSLGALDRTRMRQLIFADKDAKKKLEKILHPLILEASKSLINQIDTKNTYAILVAPLLLESPEFLQLVQRVLVIECSEKQQISRVMQRSGLNEIEIRAIIAQQVSSAERLERADDLIQNDGLREDLNNQVSALHQHYFSLANKTVFDGKGVFNISSALV
jgi:dephospho-CoA kinase